MYISNQDVTSNILYFELNEYNFNIPDVVVATGSYTMPASTNASVYIPMLYTYQANRAYRLHLYYNVVTTVLYVLSYNIV